MELKTYSWSLLFSFTCIFILGTVFAFNFSYAFDIDNEYDLKRLLVIGFIWLFSLFLCAVKDVQLIRLSLLTKLCLGIFFMLASYSALFSMHPFWGMVEIANVSLLIAVFYLFSTCLRAINRNTFHLYVYVCVLSFSVLTFVKYTCFLAFSYVDEQSFDIHGLLSGYVNVRFFNQLQIMVVAILLLPFFDDDLAKFSRVSMILISLHWTVMLQTEARGAILSLIIAMGVMLYFLSGNIRKQFMHTMFKTLLIGSCLWLVFIILIPYWMMDTSNLQMRTGSSGRIDLWHYVLISMSEHFWFGWGPMSFTWAEGKPLPHAHPHNFVMQLLYEYGVIVTVSIVLWVLSQVGRGLRWLKQSSYVSAIPLTYGVLSALCYSLFSGVAVMPFSQFMLVFLIAMQTQYSDFNFFPIRKGTQVFMFLLVTGASLVLLSTYKHEELLPALFPRIWINGLIGY